MMMEKILIALYAFIPAIIVILMVALIVQVIAIFLEDCAYLLTIVFHMKTLLIVQVNLLNTNEII